MRLCWIHPTARTAALEPLWARFEAEMPSVLGPGVELAFRYPDRSGNFTRSLYAEHLNSVLMIEEALAAEADGCDGVFLGCWNDALWEAREMLRIPVASLSEQAMLAALTMGRRLAVVTVSEKTAVAIEQDLLAYGLRERAIARPVRSISPESDLDLLRGAVDDPHSRFIPRFEEVARACVSDGADVVLVGCGYYGPLLRTAGYTHVPDTGVPVVDSTTVALKSLESMVRIAEVTGVVKSERAQFRAPPREAIDRCRAPFRVA